ncbi:hypothetical protein KIN20_023234 [Parelaphostrongylus tenuis]|uniref:Secreted protein n=1 Tax=Parelaphostrongylus tenuis TaxID=148309 RepID=A0AAD5QVR3_PARTN|nr:hypothetical protein KIN20_023234 [Parelaphostrongylus tenuis]
MLAFFLHSELFCLCATILDTSRTVLADIGKLPKTEGSSQKRGPTLQSLQEVYVPPHRALIKKSIGIQKSRQVA